MIYMKISCENQFCIYFEDNACLLETVSFDVVGLCESCIYVNINEAYLAEQRKALRERR